MDRDNLDDPWISQFTLIERLLVAHREDWDAELDVANAASLVEVRGNVDTIVAAATYVEDPAFTPFEALHLVGSEGDTIVSSDGAYDGFAPRVDL